MYEETGDIKEKHRSGRHRKTTKEDENVLIQVVKSKRDATSKQLSDILFECRGVRVFDSTIRKRLIERGYMSIR